MTRTVLCFGDSNTHGTIPMETLNDIGRFPRDVRWTGQLAGLLPGWRASATAAQRSVALTGPVNAAPATPAPAAAAARATPSPPPAACATPTSPPAPTAPLI